ncbi:glucose-6-phosphate dehydrogenase assembly protein OpcA [Aeromicrobium senzhongii]|uniref:Glucose-6-phosphate dehydrogenase assembly protein OpcA n=1 Tax=Aeromicrobium senzhongii TaxID=2663859 RepID=A0ABX6SPL2_9ACTN|nr:glucose-6-phosphate dehydrogenase assembly protein OpcA [Aeromicrobium senzhongii]MTB86971.1 oxidoreductase [Aeromicrobium senzhongii]QNL93202.1 glucose-6-phosphate dehydrogenase assembly protein OpcA [Aeromicrobium senzhongii]
MDMVLEDTNASAVAKALTKGRALAGSPAMDMVLTLLIVTDEDNVAEAMKAANVLQHEHPSRVLGVILGDGRGKPRLDARVRVGAGSPGESVLLRMSGPLVKHSESAVLPLLLPDSPVVAWWPGIGPQEPSKDPIGRLARRRLTDSERTPSPVKWLHQLAPGYSPGDNDLAWTRLTLWRALLAAALDQTTGTVSGGRIQADDINPVAVLLRAWLECRLKVPIEFVDDDSGPQIQRVTLFTDVGDIDIRRVDTMSCEFSVPGSASRIVPIRRRTIPELLAEDLRRLDADEVYGETLAHLDGNTTKG